MTHLPSLPQGHLLDIFRRHPEIAEPLHDLAEMLMRGPSSFSVGERELMAAFISRLNGCRFCEGSHGAAAVRFGIDQTLVETLVTDMDAASLRQDLEPVFRYLLKLTSDPTEIESADVQAMLDAGWDETAVFHANMVAGFFALMNRLVEGLGLQADPNVIEMAGKHLHERGYRGLTEMLKAARINA